MSGVPQHYTSSHKVCAALYKHGQPVTIEQGVSVHGYTGMAKMWAVRTLYRDMVKAGYLLEDNGVYQISETVRKYFDGCEKQEKVTTELVQKRTNLSRGEMPVQKRDPRIRADIFFKTVGGV